jgi:hypothetical protein
MTPTPESLERARAIVHEWKHSWLDTPDYLARATAVDANMKHDLAKRIATALDAAHAKTDVSDEEIERETRSRAAYPEGSTPYIQAGFREGVRWAFERMKHVRR